MTIMKQIEKEDESVVTIELLSLCVRDTMDFLPEYSPDLSRLLVSSGLFEALEAVVPQCYADDMLHSESMCRVFSFVANGLSEWIAQTLGRFAWLLRKQPTILPAFRKQLPRSQFLHSLLACDPLVSSTMSTRCPCVPIPAGSLSLEHHRRNRFVDARAWQMLLATQRACDIHRECMGRGCRKRVEVRCKGCRTEQYCGYECQKRYAELMSIQTSYCGILLTSYSLDDQELARTQARMWSSARQVRCAPEGRIRCVW